MGGKILMNSNSSARLYDYRVVSRGSLPHFPLEYSLITRNNFQCLYSNTLFGTMTMDSASHFEFFFLSHRCSFFFFCWRASIPFKRNRHGEEMDECGGD